MTRYAEGAQTGKRRNGVVSGEADELLAARQVLYHWFAGATSDPLSGGWSRLYDVEAQRAARLAAECFRSSCMSGPALPAPGEVSPGRFTLSRMQMLLSISPAQARREHEKLFGLVSSRDCPPYETDYCPQTFSVYRAQKMADAAGFYLAFGLEPSRNRPERADHISLELEFMAWLIAKERYALRGGLEDAPGKAEVARGAQIRFFEEHLAWWVPAFAFALRRKVEGLASAAELDAPPFSFHGALAEALGAFIAGERALLAVDAPRELVAPTVEESDPCGDCCGSVGMT